MSEPAVVYARFSTEEQDARSLDDQVRRCRQLAERHGLTVIEVYSDAAVSGATLHRDGLQRLIAAARRRGGSPFRVVIVDDLSRLTRDLWDMGDLVFRELLALNVRVIDVMTGMASDNPAARQLFAALGMSNDHFLQLVRHETHRGLEGRHEQDFWTGGRVYGYRTVEETNPPDPEHPRKRMVIEPTEAAVVRRIYQMASDGFGLAAIARALNADGIPAPYDGLHPRKTTPGWGHTTIRAILRNERYTGEFIWNKRKHVRVPHQRNRRALIRPEAEWKRRFLPELAIIDAETWKAVGRRLQRRAGRPPGTGSVPHLLVGTARCGACGGPIGIIGSKAKKGVRYWSLGCSAAHSGRCSNTQSVSERRLDDAFLGQLARQLSEPGLIERMVERANAQLGVNKAPEDPTAALTAKIQVSEVACRRLTDAVAEFGLSPSLASRLRDEESRLATLKHELSKAKAEKPEGPRGSPRRLDAAEVRRALENVLELASKDRARARELIRAAMPEGLMITLGGDQTDLTTQTAKGRFSVLSGAYANRSAETEVAGARRTDSRALVPFEARIDQERRAA